MGNGLSAGHYPRGSRYRKQSLELRAAGHWEVRGPHEWSLILNSDRCLISGFRPRTSTTPAPGIPASCSPEPTSLSPPRPEPTWAQWVHTLDPSLLSGSPRNWQHPCDNYQPAGILRGLKGPGYSPPLPQARSNWVEQLGRGDPGVWNMAIKRRPWVQWPMPRKRAGEEHGAGHFPKETSVPSWGAGGQVPAS